MAQDGILASEKVRAGAGNLATKKILLLLLLLLLLRVLRLILNLRDN